MARLTLTIAALTLTSVAFAQTSFQEIKDNPNKAGGVYYAYPVTESKNTPAPKGYKPFYISHYGRHGSRYLISDKDYKTVIDKFNQAHEKNALTPLGEDVRLRLDSVWQEAQGRGGELTPLGNRQHHDIADRMYKAYPEVFTDNAEVSAASTTVMRCAHSMFAFIEGLKENNPKLVIPRESGKRNMYYLNHHTAESNKHSSEDGEWYQDYNKFYNEKTNPDRLMGTLFSDSLFVRRFVDPQELMSGLYWIAVDMQNIETPISFYDLFTPEELFDLWQIYNFSFYATHNGYPSAEGLHLDDGKNTLRNILDKADEYIAEGKTGATLRFGHDGNIIPLVALMHIKGTDAEYGTDINAFYEEADPYEVYKGYSNFKISPMASNLQLIFFKNKQGDVLVKFMLNEQEVSIPAKTDNFPFYRWEDARPVIEQMVEVPAKDFDF